MNLRRLAAAMTIALFVSALCTWLLSRKLSANDAHHAPEQRYLSPAIPLAAGEILKPENLQLIPWPAASPVSGAFTKPEELSGRALLYPIDKGQLITSQYVTTAGSGLGLAGKIPDGMRAVALRSDEVMGVGGFLLPGSHLDVLVTYRSEKLTEPITLTVLQNAIVLAAGHQVQPDPEGKPTVATVVTLLLTPGDAERAVLASTQGAIHFILRSGSDKTRDRTVPILLSQLSADAAPAPPVTKPLSLPTAPSIPPRALARAADHYTVETILGDKPTTETFPRPGPQ